MPPSGQINALEVAMVLHDNMQEGARRADASIKAVEGSLNNLRGAADQTNAALKRALDIPPPKPIPVPQTPRLGNQIGEIKQALGVNDEYIAGLRRRIAELKRTEAAEASLARHLGTTPTLLRRATGEALAAEKGFNTLGVALNTAAGRAALLAPSMARVLSVGGSVADSMAGVAASTAGASAGLGMVALGLTSVGVVAGVTLTGIIALGKRFGDLGENLTNQASVVGLSVQNYQALDLALKQIGSSVGEVELGLRTMERRIADGDVALKKLGVTSQDPFTALLQMSDAMHQVEGTAQSASIAFDVFGRNAGKITPFLSQGSAAIAEQMRWIKEHAVLTETSVKAMQAMDAAADALGLQMAALGATLGNTVLPAFADLAVLVTNAASKVVEFLRISFEHTTDELIQFEKVWELVGYAVATASAALGSFNNFRFGNLEEGNRLLQEYRAGLEGLKYFTPKVFDKRVIKEAREQERAPVVKADDLVNRLAAEALAQAKAGNGFAVTDAIVTRVNETFRKHGDIVGFVSKEIRSLAESRARDQFAINAQEDAQKRATKSLEDFSANVVELQRLAATPTSVDVLNDLARSFATGDIDASGVLTRLRGNIDEAKKVVGELVPIWREVFEAQKVAAALMEKLPSIAGLIEPVELGLKVKPVAFDYGEWRTHLSSLGAQSGSWYHEAFKRVLDEQMTADLAFAQERLRSLPKAGTSEILTRNPEAIPVDIQAALDSARQAADAAESILVDLGRTMSSAFEEVLTSILDGTSNWADQMSKLMRRLVASIIAEFAKLAAIKFFSAILGLPTVNPKALVNPGLGGTDSAKRIAPEQSARSIKVDVPRSIPVTVAAPASIPVAVTLPRIPALVIPTIPPVVVNATVTARVPAVPDARVRVTVDRPESIPVTVPGAIPVAIPALPALAVTVPTLAPVTVTVAAPDSVPLEARLPASIPVAYEAATRAMGAALAGPLSRPLSVDAPALRVERPTITLPNLNVDVAVSAPEIAPLSVPAIPRLTVEPVPPLAVAPAGPIPVETPAPLTLAVPPLSLTVPPLPSLSVQAVTPIALALEVPTLSVPAIPSLAVDAPDSIPAVLRGVPAAIPVAVPGPLAVAVPEIAVSAPGSIPVTLPRIDLPALAVAVTMPPAPVVPPIQVPDFPRLTVESVAPVPVLAPGPIPVAAPASIPVAVPSLALEAPTLPRLAVDRVPALRMAVDVPELKVPALPELRASVDAPRSIPAILRDLPSAIPVEFGAAVAALKAALRPVTVDAPASIPVDVPRIAVPAITAAVDMPEAPVLRLPRIPVLEVAPVPPIRSEVSVGRAPDVQIRATAAIDLPRRPIPVGRIEPPEIRIPAIEAPAVRVPNITVPKLEAPQFPRLPSLLVTAPRIPPVAVQEPDGREWMRQLARTLAGVDVPDTIAVDVPRIPSQIKLAAPRFTVPELRAPDLPDLMVDAPRSIPLAIDRRPIEALASAFTATAIPPQPGIILPTQVPIVSPLLPVPSALLAPTLPAGATFGAARPATEQPPQSVDQRSFYISAINAKDVTTSLLSPFGEMRRANDRLAEINS